MVPLEAVETWQAESNEDHDVRALRHDRRLHLFLFHDPFRVHALLLWEAEAEASSSWLICY
jgi:hypothetical protein